MKQLARDNGDRQVHRLPTGCDYLHEGIDVLVSVARASSLHGALLAAKALIYSHVNVAGIRDRGTRPHASWLAYRFERDPKKVICKATAGMVVAAGSASAGAIQCIDLKLADYSNRTPIQLYDCNGKPKILRGCDRRLHGQRRQGATL